MRNKILIFILVLFFAGGTSLAQNLSDAVLDQRKILEEELSSLESEIKNYETLIKQKRSEGVTLKRDIAIIDAQIEKTRLEIRSLEVIISRLTNQILEKEKSITEIEQTIEKQKDSLIATLKKLREYDNYSLIEVMLSYDRLSDYFGDIDAIDVVQDSLQQEFSKLRQVKNVEETLRDEYITEKNEQVQGRALMAIEKRNQEKKEQERRRILKETQGKEEVYKKITASKKKDAAGIRSQLFLLEGSPAIPFEKAVLFAERASKKTGVRVAFILGIIAQESELGRNIGQCNLPNDPPKYKWDAIMKPSRDHKPYLSITSRLGLDPNLMPLSCPMSVGWGGAMGPAQFIPSTWILFENRIADATGHNPPNPWEPEDAFMASGMFLSDLGADSKAGESEAAGRYFAGSRWNSSLGRSYSRQVLSKVSTYQEQIDILSGL